MRIWLNIMRLIMHHARHFLTGLNHESLLGKKTGLVTIALGIIQFVLVKGGCIDYIPRMSVPTVRLTETRCHWRKLFLPSTRSHDLYYHSHQSQLSKNVRHDESIARF